MKILLTGSSGTIGTRLFEQLLPHHEVVGVDIRKNQWSQKLDEKTIIADLRKERQFQKLPDNIDIVIHFAANAKVYKSVVKPKLAFDNMLMNFNVLEYVRKKGINKYIYASSRETYGNLKVEGAISEDMVRIESSESPYSASKVAGEALTHAYGKVYGIEYIIIRFSNVYGMYDDSDRVIPSWIRQTLKGKDLIVYGKEKYLDFTYIDDSTEAVQRMLQRFDRVKGNTFNISYGKKISLLSIAENIQELFGTNNKLILREVRPGEVYRFEGDISKARKLLGYQPRIDIKEGMQKTVEWYKSFYSALKRD